jgi:Domain of unknown function (DUF4367)
MTMNDDFLKELHEEPRPAFATALYQRINKPMQAKSKPMTLRFTTLTLSLLAVLAVTLFFSPTLRAQADTILGQFSAYIFVQATPAAVPPKAADAKKLEVQSAPSREGAYQFAPDAAGASQLAGFTVITPAYIPEGLTPSTIDDVTGGWRITSKWGGEAALVNFDNGAENTFLVIEELKIGQDQPMTVERPEIVAVTVRGLPGAWVPDGTDGKSALVWDENGVTYSVISNKLPLEELQKVAESLGQ